MSDSTTKGPGWWVLGLVLFAGLSALVRALDLPDTWTGVLVKTTVQVVGALAVIALCVTGLPARRRLVAGILVAFPIVLFGNTAWRAYLGGLSPDDEELITAVAALAVGIGIGSTIAAWIYQGRKRLNC